jgi:D-alanine transaminase
VPESVYLNDKFLPAREATISVFDRGLLFADAVYEVAGVIDSKLLDFESHMVRLDRSLTEMGIICAMTHDEILNVMRELVRLEGVDEGLVYIQFTRGGSYDREFLPPEGLKPNVFGFAQHKSPAIIAEIRDGIKMVSVPDTRWSRRHIKTVGLMGSVFAKLTAKEAGGQEALLYQDGYVTEGAATSFFMVQNQTLITRPLSDDILQGCTRKALLQLVDEKEIKLEERLFTLDEASESQEAFITGASTYITPVVQIDGTILGDGRPGQLTRRLQEIYVRFARETAI